MQVIRLAVSLEMKLGSIQLLLFGALCPILAQAQSPDLNGIAHLAFRVSDLEASGAFYNKLGFEQAFELTKDGRTTEAFVKVNDRQFIELYPNIGTESSPIGLMHFCFEAANLQALNDEYVRRGLDPSPVRKAGAGNLLFTLHNPEKQLLEYTQYMPGSMHSKDRGKHLGSRRISQHLAGASLAVADRPSERAFYNQKLAFEPESGADPYALLLPGHSGEKLKLVSASESGKTTVFFTVADLKAAAEYLRSQGLVVKTQSAVISVTDPDGNSIVFTIDGRP